MPQENRKWWEAHPMIYDWNEKPEQIKAGLDYFREVDRRMRDGHWFAQENEEPLFSRLIPYPSLKGKRVLEIGCGLGSIAQELARQGASVTAVDITSQAVRLSSSRFALQSLPGSFIQADAEELPFGPEAFDYVWSWGVLHHTPGTQKAVREIFRVLSPGGRAAVMVYNRRSLRNFLRIILFRGIAQLGFLKYSLEELENRYSDGAIAKHYAPANALKLFKEFENVRLSVFGQRSEIFPGYHLLPGLLSFPVEPLARALLRRFGWFLFIEARKPA